MNIYKTLNEITKYIDNNLENEIAYEDIAKMMGVNVYTMQRIFSLLAGITLADYIRKRRLSSAGFDLYNGNVKVIDISLKYGYESATAFSRAFYNFHGIKPSMVTRNTKLKNFPRIIFRENTYIVNEMDYEVISLDKLNLYGIGVNTNNQDISMDAPMFFKNMEAKYRDLYGEIKYGMVEYKDSMRCHVLRYLVLYDKEINDFENIEIEASKWLKFSINSQEASDIQEMSHKFYLEFLPSCKYNLKDIPELEYYHDGVCDFLVAIY